jgi:rubrerythrin
VNGHIYHGVLASSWPHFHFKHAFFETHSPSSMFGIFRVFTSFSTFLLNPITWILAHVSGRYVQQMEKFKACEKEMKTKAFSKEGLIQAAKLDPKEQEKEEAMQWVNHNVEELQMQVEQTEAELETMQGAVKKRKGTSGNPGRQEELEHLNDRRKWHISRLEIVLRMLNNGSLPLEKVNELKDDVTYFVESNAVRQSVLLASR